MDHQDARRRRRGGTDNDHEFWNDINRKNYRCMETIEEPDPEHPGYYNRRACGRGRTAPEHRLWHVTVYKIDRAYGGPEEGGWWYDYGTVLVDVTLKPQQYYEAVAVQQAFVARFAGPRD